MKISLILIKYAIYQFCEVRRIIFISLRSLRYFQLDDKNNFINKYEYAIYPYFTFFIGI